MRASLQARKHDRAVKHAEEGHTAALLGLEGKLAGRQQEVGELQQLNQRLLSRLQTMREQLAHSQDKLSHTQIRGGPPQCCQASVLLSSSSCNALLLLQDKLTHSQGKLSHKQI